MNRSLIFIKAVIFFAILASRHSSAQNVQVCITVNGSSMPATKIWNMCSTNIATPANLSSAVLSATNCATSPATNVSYKWKNLTTFTETAGATVTATSPGLWEVTITNLTTMQEYKEVLTILLHPPIGVSIIDMPEATANITCLLFPVTLTTIPLGPVSSYSWYEYFPKVAITGATGSSLTFQKKLRSYISEVRDVHGCVNADTSRHYPQTDYIKVDLGPDPSVFCEGNTFPLASTVPFGLFAPQYYIYYGIVGGPSLGSTTATGTGPAPPVNFTPIGGTHTYWMRIEGWPSCAGYDEITITTKPKPVVDAGPTSVFNCYGSNTNLSATIISGTPPYTYSWSSVPASSLPGGPNITVNPSTSTVYTVSVTDAVNCSAGTDNITVDLNPQIIVAASNDTTICITPAGTAQLQAIASGGAGGFTYSWSPASGLSSTNTLATTASVSTNTTYTFTATDINNCSQSEPVIVKAYEPPPSPEIKRPTVISESKSATLDAAFAGNNGCSFIWKTDTTATIMSTTSSIYLEYQGPDTVNYVLTITNPSNGCINIDTFAVHSISDNIIMYIPNIFSPNAINPQNQTLKIYSNNLMNDGFKWMIFNKWGNLMYEITDLENAQTVGLTGDSMNEGVYTYVISGKFKNGRDIKDSPYYKGTFSLVK